ncbi:hypothetical protein QS257_01690 [Terrilactibacillus sp. S3-3]|nr:hypothetical protein QS257_01690 [Terrilactibacillus sp. S3-3]
MKKNLSLLKLFNQKDSFSRSRRILTQKEIIDILARFSIHAGTQQIIDFLNYLIGLYPNVDEFCQRDIKNALNKLKFCFNQQILYENFALILSANYSDLYLSNYFTPTEKQPSKIIEQFIPEILKNAQSDRIVERDDAISRLLLIRKSNT